MSKNKQNQINTQNDMVNGLSELMKNMQNQMQQSYWQTYYTPMNKLKSNDILDTLRAAFITQTLQTQKCLYETVTSVLKENVLKSIINLIEEYKLKQIYHEIYKENSVGRIFVSNDAVLCECDEIVRWLTTNEELHSKLLGLTK